jgi:hypothetical protein
VLLWQLAAIVYHGQKDMVCLCDLEVLERNSHDAPIMKQIAAVEISIDELDEARNWRRKVLDEEPRDAESAYSIGVIDWTKAHLKAQRALSATGFRDNGA